MSDSESESSLSDDPIDEEPEPEPEPEPELEKKKSRGRPKKEKVEKEPKQPKPVILKKVTIEPRKKPEWSAERKKEFAERMRKAREAKRLQNGNVDDRKKKKVELYEPEMAELIKEGRKARKAKLRADIKKEAVKILKQEKAENIVSDSESSDSEPEMKEVKKYITKRKAKKKAREIKPKPTNEVISDNNNVSQINEPSYIFM